MRKVLGLRMDAVQRIQAGYDTGAFGTTVTSSQYYFCCESLKLFSFSVLFDFLWYRIPYRISRYINLVRVGIIASVRVGQKYIDDLLKQIKQILNIYLPPFKTRKTTSRRLENLPCGADALELAPELSHYR